MKFFCEHTKQIFKRMFKVSGLRRAGGERRKSLCEEAKAWKSLQTLPQQEAAYDYTGQ